MSYTQDDHLFRGDDVYAQGKYELSLRWLKSESSTRSMVNIGCGAGDFNHLAAAAGFAVSAYEPDPKAAAIALAGASPQVRVHAGGLADALSVEPSSQLVVMHDVLEHIEDDVAAIGMLARIIAPGGHLLLTVPAMPCLFGRHDEELFHFRRYSRSALLHLLKKDFEIQRFRWYGFLFMPITLLFSVWLRKPYPKPDGKKGLMHFVASTLIAIEKIVPFPLGTSILLLARRR